MNRIGILLVIAAGLAATIGLAIAQSNNLEFTCIGANTTSACSNGDTSLREYATAGTKYVSVSGYRSAGDGGSGEFYDLGSTTAVCQSNGGFTGTAAVGHTTISTPGTLSTSGLTVGELVTASGTGIQTQPGTEIASIDSATQITVTLPLTGTTGTSLSSIAFTGDNGGTLIVDAVGDCYQKTNYRGDPHEFGAYGDNGGHDDTTFMQNWIGAFGNLPSTTPTATVPTNFGPWIASVPANYQVSTSLVCPPNAVLQGFANNTAGSPAGGAGSPTVRIFAASSGFQGTSTAPLPALMMAGNYCRISGIALDVNGNGGNSFINTAGTTTSGNTSISVTSGGGGGFPSWVVRGVPISDSGNCIAAGTTIVSVFGAMRLSATISQPATGTCSGTDTFTVTGFYAVDIVGTHVVIDGHSLLEQGYYNVHCGDLQVDGLQIKDSQIFKAWDTGVHLANNCANVRVLGDIVQTNGQDGTGFGISFSGNDLSLQDGIVEQTGGADVSIASANLVSITGMTVDSSGQGGNGNPPGGQGVIIANSQNVTVTGNRIQGSGGDATGSAQVFLSGVLDNLNFAGNTYVTRSAGNDANVNPWYVFDTSSTLTLTNSHIYDTPTQPAVSVFSPTAQPFLQSLLVPQFTNNLLSGLVLSNDTMNAQQIDIAPGAAADSTNSTVIQLPPVSAAPACSVNLAMGSGNGAGHLDTGNVAANTTYYIFLIAAPAASGGSSIPTPSCMASTTLVPKFKGAYFPSSGYLVTATGGTLNTSSTIYNVSPLAGVSAGNTIDSSHSAFPDGTLITGFSANSVPVASPPPITGMWSSGSTSITLSPGSITNIQAGMAVAGGCLPGNTYVVSYTTPTLVISSNAATCAGSLGTPVSISGARQLVIGATAGSTHAQDTLTIHTGYYRLLGALYTDGSSNVVKFTQEGDTFYLTTPVTDINTTGSICSGTIGTSTPCQLSVPCGRLLAACAAPGIKVEAFGRLISGSPNQLLISSPDQTNVPANFPTAPGYTTSEQTNSGTAATTAYPFKVYTDGNGTVHMSSNGTGTTSAYEVTDGWVWPRAQ